MQIRQPDSNSPVESSERIAAKHATPLERLAGYLGGRLRMGIVVHPGRRVEEMAPGIYAVPDAVLFG